MPTILTRAGKGSDLTPTEADSNLKKSVRRVTTTAAGLISDNRGTIEGLHAATPFTITLLAVATAAAAQPGDYSCTVSNIGAAAVTLDANGSETINGSTDTLTLARWSSVTVEVDSAGTGWQIIARTGDIGAVTAKAVAATTVTATTVTASGIVSVDDTTDTSSGTTGSIHTDGGVGIVKKLWVGLTATITGILTATAGIISGGNIVSDTDSTDDLGTTGARWKELFVDTITATDQMPVEQIVNTQISAMSTGTTAIPFDDSIPQIAEGDEYMTLSITPKNTNNKLKIEILFNFAHNQTTERIAVALFQDATGNALAAGWGAKGQTGDAVGLVSLTHYMTAGTTSATTLRVRAGGSTGSTTTFNGFSAARKFGGVMASSITITEYKV